MGNGIVPEAVEMSPAVVAEGLGALALFSPRGPWTVRPDFGQVVSPFSGPALVAGASIA
jgi:hypothetical protein